jgi:hypothetical protein
MKPATGTRIVSLGLTVAALAASLFCGTTSVFANGNSSPDAAPTHEIIVVVGAPGGETYAQHFTRAAEAWTKAGKVAGAKVTHIGLTKSEASDRDRLRSTIEQLDTRAMQPVWLVYVGHGTFDGKQSWLNLHGPDVSAEELSAWLRGIRERPLIFVHGGSAAGPLLPQLSGPNRIVIVATRSGDEVNYARFGERFASAIGSPRADVDQDGSTSLLEAFLLAAKDTAAFYAETGRLATEHPLIDDNGDRLGTPPEWFQGVRVVKRPENQKAEPDGFRAHQIALLETPTAAALTAEQRAQRDALERELEAIRARRDKLSEEQYLREIEPVLRRLAEFYRE